MVRTSSMMVRIFKEEGKLEIWKAKTDNRYDMIANYEICKWSGKLGPKFTEGDRQAPEGFYSCRPRNESALELPSLLQHRLSQPL